MRRSRLARFCGVALWMAAALAGTAQADVVSSDAGGFTIHVERTTHASPAAAFALLGQPGRWWSSTHSWSGDARSMTISPQEAGGCWCELLPESGSVEHGRVIMWDPENGRIRFRAELGPLQIKAAYGRLEWIAVAGPDGLTHVAMHYEVAGRGFGDVAAFAAAVDAVLSEQLDRFVAESEHPTTPTAPALAPDAPVSLAPPRAASR